MTKIPSDDILEGLYKLRIRASEKLKTVLELYDLEIHQKKIEPDYQRLNTMVKRSIEQNLRVKNFESRHGNYETNAVVKNQGTKQRVQRILGDCWQWEFNGQCSKGDNCSFRQDINKRAKITHPNPAPSSSTRQNERNASRTRIPRGKSPSGRMSRCPCKDYLLGTCANSFCEKWHPPECSCSTRRRVVADFVKSALVRINWVAEKFFVLEPPKSSSILRKSSNILKPIRCVRFTKAVARHADIRDQYPSLGMICPGDPHQRNTNAPKFEDRSQEETEWQKAMCP